jgi:ZIP family zinc transporter
LKLWKAIIWIEAAESAVGIIVHDVTDGLNTILLVTRGRPAENKDIIFLLADAAAPVVGGILVLFSRLSSHQLALFLGITSGFFCSPQPATCFPMLTGARPIFVSRSRQ